MILSRRSPRGRRVVIHTKRPDDQTLSGVLIGDYPDRLVLEDAAYVQASGETPIARRVYVPQANVSWLEEL